jgi:hypothetical protein
MSVTFHATPFRTVHATAVIPAQDAGKARRSISAQAGRRGLGKRVTIREHVIGETAFVFAIYRR